MRNHYIPELALEGAIDGKKSRELEYTIYAKLKDMSQLTKAPEKEEHEQWQLPLKVEGPVRARLRLINGRRYTMTTKAKRDGVAGWEEVDSDIPEDLFNHLKEMCINGYKKTRYSFPIAGTNHKWEIDVFMDSSGKPHPWVKIDLEVDSPTDPIPDFHLEIEKCIIENHKSTTPDEERFVKKLWDDEWVKIEGNIRPGTEV